MPRIIIQANAPGGDAEITLSEHVVAANLDAAHYRSQLLDRLTWAAADAEALESRDNPIRSPRSGRRKPARGVSRRPSAPLSRAAVTSA